MNLIEQIESAAEAHSNNGPVAFYTNLDAQIADSVWWPRLKAALEAAQDMDELLERNGIDHASIRKFREAMNGDGLD